MTSTPIAPVVPSRRSTSAKRRRREVGETRGHRPLPVAVIASRPTPAVVYRIAAVDKCGRLAERTVMRALGWAPGLTLDIAEAGRTLIVRADPAGAFRTTSSHGHLILPARVRSWCGLRVGDRVLLAADPDKQELLVCPPAALDAMLAALHSWPLDQTLTRPSNRSYPTGGEPA